MSNYYTQVQCSIGSLKPDQFAWLEDKDTDLSWWQDTYKDELLEDVCEVHLEVVPHHARDRIAIEDDGEYANLDHVEHLLKEFQEAFPLYQKPITVVWCGHGGEIDGGCIVVYPDRVSQWTNTWEWVGYMSLLQDGNPVPLHSVPSIMLPLGMKEVANRHFMKCEEKGHEFDDRRFNPKDHSILATCKHCGLVELVKPDGDYDGEHDCNSLSTFDCSGGKA